MSDGVLCSDTAKTDGETKWQKKEVWEVIRDMELRRCTRGADRRNWMICTSVITSPP
jgi:hypothetical protein